jgi:acyl-CoA thioesterase
MMTDRLAPTTASFPVITTTNSVRQPFMSSFHSPRRMMSSNTVSEIPSKFDQETALERVSSEGEQSTTFRVQVTDSWSIGDAPNGGFLMYLAIQACSEICSPFQHPDPFTFTAYYVTKALEHKPADLTVRVVGRTKSASIVHVTMSQEGQIRSEYLGTMGNLDSMQGMDHNKKSPPTLPHPKDCLNASQVLRQAFGDQLKICRELEMRVPLTDPMAKGLFRGKKGDVAELTSWVSFKSPKDAPANSQRVPCLSSLAFFLDALPPPVLNISKTNWVPTLEYTVHFWSKPTTASTLEDEALPSHHWLRTTFVTSFVNNGMLYTDGEIWSHDGKELLATSRQMARLLEPRKPL